MYNKTKVFIEKTKEVHKNEYDYSLSKYIKSKIDIKIICKEHMGVMNNYQFLI